MYHASFTKSFPDLIKSVSQKLTQPTSIAVMASVGIHALVGVALPYLPLSSQEKPQTRRTVQLVELTPTEQSRLPQLSQLPLTLPPTGQLPPLSSLYPPLPKNSSLYNLPPVSSTLPANGLGLRLPRSQSTTRSRSPIQFQNSRNLRIFNGSTRIQPPPQWMRPSPALSQLLDQQNLKPATSLPPAPTSNTATGQTASPNPTPVKPESQERPPTEVASSTPPSQPSSQTPKSSVPSTPVSVTQRQQQLIAQRLAEIRQERENLRADNTNTSQDDAKRNDVAWRLQTQQTVKEKQLALTGTYPKAACFKQLKGTAVYNILVDGNGKPSNVQLIRSAGYPILNQQAEKQINSHGFEKTGEPRFYQVSVNFEYNKAVCPTLTPPQTQRTGMG